jgi:hypothetical protein
MTKRVRDGVRIVVLYCRRFLAMALAIDGTYVRVWAAVVARFKLKLLCVGVIELRVSRMETFSPVSQ